MRWASGSVVRDPLVITCWRDSKDKQASASAACSATVNSGGTQRLNLCVFPRWWRCRRMVSALTLSCCATSSHVWPLSASTAASRASLTVAVGLPDRGPSSRDSSPSCSFLYRLWTVRSFTTSVPKAWHIFRAAAVALLPSLNPYNVHARITIFGVPPWTYTLHWQERNLPVEQVDSGQQLTIALSVFIVCLTIWGTLAVRHPEKPTELFWLPLY
jgi:hypothetical protein